MSSNDEIQSSSPLKMGISTAAIIVRVPLENAPSSFITEGQGQYMISAGQASAGYIGDSRTGQPIKRQPIFGSKAVHRSNEVAEREPRVQNRPARGTNEAGLQRIVDGMRLALRTRNSIHVKRKDIAQYARVTPALITYYFPEKDDLIEAVTLPVVDALVDGVDQCLNDVGTPRENLLKAVGLLIEYYARDAAIIELFVTYRASKADKIPDLLQKMEAAFTTFFEHSLQQNQDSVYDAVYLQKAAIGMCKIVARRYQEESVDDGRRVSEPMSQAEAICAILLQPVFKAEKAAVSVSNTGSALGL